MKWVVGIDEVGRGALAGPVVVAAAALPEGLTFQNRKLGRLKDSKKLSVKQREAWLAYFASQPAVNFAVARVYPRQIERRNISSAANVAAKRAFHRLANTDKTDNRMNPKTPIFLDGGLFLGNGDQPRSARTIIKGDEKITAIKIASIVAKVHRDRLMCRLAKHYPLYGFEAHKGYGTKAHRHAIKRHGPCEAHRKSFKPIAKLY